MPAFQKRYLLSSMLLSKLLLVGQIDSTSTDFDCVILAEISQNYKPEKQALVETVTQSVEETLRSESKSRCQDSEMSLSPPGDQVGSQKLHIACKTQTLGGVIMKRITTTALHFVFLVALVFNTGHNLAQQETQGKKKQTKRGQVPVQSIPRPLPDTIRRLQEANKAFRDAVAHEMQAAARQAGVKIRMDNFIAIPFDDSHAVVVNAMIEGADRVSIEQLAKGADVLFVYSGTKLGAAERQIDPGFYVVRVSQNAASGQWVAQFRNLQGRVVLETDAAVDKPDSNAAKMQPMCTLGPKGELILFDEHDPFKNLVIKISSRACPSCAGLRFVSESGKLRQAARDYLEYLAKNNPEVGSFMARYSNFAPVSIPQTWDWTLVSGTMKISCEEFYRTDCIRIVHCTDGQHHWGIVMTNRACADVPTYIHWNL